MRMKRNQYKGFKVKRKTRVKALVARQAELNDHFSWSDNDLLEMESIHKELVDYTRELYERNEITLRNMKSMIDAMM